LPVPDSPWISTVDSVGATVSASRRTSSQLQRPILHAQLSVFGGAREDGDELVVPEGLLDVIEGALVDGLHGRLERRLRRHEDHRGVRILLSSRGEDLHTAHVRHADVSEDDVGLKLGELLQARPAAACGVGVESRVAQQDAERLQDALFVVDHEDGGDAICGHN
jgi:hypothetical protein